MKNKLLLGALLFGCAFTASADGYTDGIEYYKAGQYNNALTVLNRTLNDPTTNKALSYYYIGNINLLNNNAAEAKANYDKGISADPNCPYNYVGLGSIELKNGNVKAAEEQFKTAQKLGKKNHEILVDIARAYYNADPVKYATQVDKFLEKAHKDSKNTEPAIYILEGDMLFDKKELGNAAAKYEQAITFDKDNPEGYVKYAAAYMGVNPQYGIAKLEELLEKQPTSALAQRELAERYYEIDQWTKAANQYGKYMSNPNHFPEDKTRYLVLVYANSDYQKAIQIADEILSATPNNAQALRVKMFSEFELKDYANAKKTAEHYFSIPIAAGEKSPYNFRDYATYGQILEELGDLDGAIAQYEKAVSMDPKRVDNIKLLSSAYASAKNFQKSAEVYQMIIDAATPEEEASLTDYLTLSGRWLNAAANAADPEVAAADAAKGIPAIDKVIEEAENVTPTFYQRRALLLFFKEGKTVTQPVADAYLTLVTELDKDPANADPNNDANRLAWYKQAYGILAQYYTDLGDKEKTEEMYAKYTAIP